MFYRFKGKKRKYEFKLTYDVFFGIFFKRWFSEFYLCSDFFFLSNYFMFFKRYFNILYILLFFRYIRDILLTPNYFNWINFTLFTLFIYLFLLVTN